MSDVQKVTGTSLSSFEEAAEHALAEMSSADPGATPVEADVAQQWVEVGGVVGRIQFHVELVPRRPSRSEHAAS